MADYATDGERGCRGRLGVEMSLDKLEDWADFAKREFAKPPTRRVGKRLVLSKEIPGRIIDGKPFVYTNRYYLQDIRVTKNTDVSAAAIELLK